jgi:LacI family transcriptional regulator
MTLEIAVSIDPVSDNNRGMLRGVIDYVSQHPELRVFKVGAVPYVALGRLRSWRGAGAICVAETASELKQLVALKIPRVSVSLHQQPPAGLPTVHSDNQAIGRLAADHLRNLGLTNFALVGYLRWRHNLERLEGFRQALRAQGHDCQVVNVRFASGRQTRTWTADLKRQALKQSLKSLPYPLGILATHDEFAHDVVQSLRELGVQVPSEAAVIGVNNYRLICETSHPPLSSIAQASHQIGYAAAKLLHELIEGKPPPKRPVLIPPGRLVARLSSDYTAVADQAVLAALQFMRQNCGSPITVEDVVEQSAVSRRTLDKRFQAALGHPTAEALRLTRMKKARELLATSDVQVIAVGMACGYDSPSGFVWAFREAAGETPQRYRRRVQEAAAVNAALPAAHIDIPEFG